MASQVNLPTLDKHNMSAWFFKVEQIFQARDTTNENKFAYVAATLDSDMIDTARAIPDGEGKYERLKAKLLLEYGKDLSTELKEIFEGDQLKKEPVRLLQKMRIQLNGLGNEAQKAIFINKLPQEMRLHLEMAPGDTTLDQLAEMARRGLKNHKPTIQAIQQEDEKNTTKTKETESQLQQTLERLVQKIEDLQLYRPAEGEMAQSLWPNPTNTGQPTKGNTWGRPYQPPTQADLDYLNPECYVMPGGPEIPSAWQGYPPRRPAAQWAEPGGQRWGNSAAAPGGRDGGYRAPARRNPEHPNMTPRPEPRTWRAIEDAPPRPKMLALPAPPSYQDAVQTGPTTAHAPRANTTTRGTNNGRGRERPPRDPEAYFNEQGYCRYHQQFGQKANRCEGPCGFKRARPEQLALPAPSVPQETSRAREATASGHRALVTTRGANGGRGRKTAYAPRANTTTRGTNGGRGRERPTRDPEAYFNEQGYCRYHQQFGQKANRCEGPCGFKRAFLPQGRGQ